VTVYIQEPSAAAGQASRQFGKQFSARLWLLIGLTALLIAALLSAVSCRGGEPATHSICNSLFYVFYVFCQQSK
jgi:hypothetical protein